MQVGGHQGLAVALGAHQPGRYRFGCLFVALGQVLANFQEVVAILKTAGGNRAGGARALVMAQGAAA